MIIRGICCLVPGIKNLSDNIEVISIVDRFLEHPRVMIFENCGNPKVFISSADLMNRNIYERVEVGCPIYDDDLKKQVIENFSIGWKDNVKARIINSKKGQNIFKNSKKSIIRSQLLIHSYFKSLVEGNEN